MRGFFGVAVYHVKREANVGGLWRVAHTYGAALLATVGARYDYQASDATHAAGAVPLVHHATLDDLVAHLPHGAPLVGVELAPGATSLTRFAAPTARRLPTRRGGSRPAAARPRALSPRGVDPDAQPVVAQRRGGGRAGTPRPLRKERKLT